ERHRTGVFQAVPLPRSARQSSLPVDESSATRNERSSLNDCTKSLPSKRTGELPVPNASCVGKAPSSVFQRGFPARSKARAVPVEPKYAYTPCASAAGVSEACVFEGWIWNFAGPLPALADQRGAPLARS